MLDNLGTALVQAFGFFAIFGYFVYQTLFANKKSSTSQTNITKTRNLEPKINNREANRFGIFNRKKEPVKDEINSQKKGLFSKKKELKNEEIKSKKKSWFK